MSDPAPQSRRFELGLLGFPVAHSASAAMHTAALAQLGLDGTYALWPVPDAAQLEPFLERIRTGALAGANVTIPWKVDVAQRCDALVGHAKVIGAVNTIVGDPDGRAVGHNTDVGGLAASVAESFPGRSFVGRAVTVIGAGGAARSAILAAELLGAAEIRVYNRTPGTAHAVCETLGRGIPTETLAGALSCATLVLQASASGFNLSQPATVALANELAASLGHLAPDAVLYDLVYAPSPTAWMLAAQTVGREAVDGLGMLVHQAALAFALWTGQVPDVGRMYAAARAHVAGRAKT